MAKRKRPKDTIATREERVARLDKDIAELEDRAKKLRNQPPDGYVLYNLAKKKIISEVNHDPLELTRKASAMSAGADPRDLYICELRAVLQTKVSVEWEPVGSVLRLHGEIRETP